MIIENEKLIDFTVYKYVIPKTLHIATSIVVLLVILAFYIVYLPVIWLVPLQKILEPLDDLID